MKRSTASGMFGRGGRVAGAMPDFEHRAEQERMMEAVEAAIAHHDVCLVEAGTGVGKTLAYLAPSLLSGRQVVVATGTRALMDQIHQRDVPLLKQVLDKPFTATVLKGRGNYLCIPRLQAAWDATGGGEEERKLAIRIRRWARTTATGDLAELTDLPEGEPLLRRVACSPDACPGRACPDFSRCFLFAARARARESDLVITNHHLFFADLGGREDSGAGLLPDDAILVFDEAQGLEDVAAEHFGRSAASGAVAEVARDATDLAKRGDPSEGRLLLGAASRLAGAFQALVAALAPEDGRVEVTPERAPAAARRLWHMLDADMEIVAHEALDLASAIDIQSDVPARVERLRDTLGLVLGASDAAWVRVAERKGRLGSLQAVPVDVSDRLRRSVFLTARSIVLTSATLTVDGSTAFVRRRLGVPEGATEVVLASPYDFAKQVLLYLPETLPDPNDDAFADAFSREAAAVLEATRGRAFLLFTSHAALKRALERMRGAIPWPVFAQGEAPRDELVRRFRAAGNGCLFGTYTFWEGVDVAGPSLSCVVIDRLPFDPPDEPVVRARAEAARLRGEDRFEDYQLPLAVIRLRQGFGRLVRRRSDRGVVAILDRRIRSKRYGEVFLKSLPPAPATSDLAEVQRWCRKHLR
jgi:ATP-dependent DNA helicase DinG